MSGEAPARREVRLPSKGAKIGIAIGVLLIATSVLVLVWPLQLTTQDGSAFRCGSGFAPPAEEFPKSVCGALSDRSRWLSLWFAVAGVVVMASGFWVFGTVTSLRVIEPDEPL